MSDREIMDAKYPKQKTKQLPDARKHQAIVLILSEIIGIVEELV